LVEGRPRLGDHHRLSHQAGSAGSGRVFLRLASPSLNATKTSAGLLLYRRTAAGLQIFLAHPGGPFWRGRDAGAWTIPKGIAEPGEDLLTAACREFEEETGVHPTGPFIPLGVIRQKAGKLVHAWAWEGEADAATITSNTMKTEWPRGSGRWLTFPEVDRCAWLTPGEARLKINPAQRELIDRLENMLVPPPPAA
jgi:predicted NUDIX family NTP pyrophosphohydrolase